MKKNNLVLTSIPLLLCAIIFSGCMLWDVEEMREKSRPKSKDKDAVYTVTYDRNGSTGGTAPVDGKSYQSGAAVTVLGNTGNLARSGYTFTGWNTAANGSGISYAAGATFTISADIILYARWVPVNANTVTFNSNGGSATANQNVASGGRAIRPANPTKSGYVFGDWYKDAACTALYNFSDAVNSNITLYAKWFEGIISGTGIELISIPSGTFTMGTVSGGSNDERPVRQVTLSSFKMGKYEVTQEQYQAVMGTKPSYFNSNPASGEIQDKRPVEQVSWYDAIVFCNKLSIGEGLTPAYRINGSTNPDDWGNVPSHYDDAWNAVTIVTSSTGYRLPTEAEWEYACRAGTATDWHFGNNESELDDYAWYWDNSDSMTHEVGKKQPNAYGLYDMHGNVWEWCWDWYGTYENGNANNPVGPSTGTSRVDRGGCWSISASFTRSAYRGGSNPDFRLSNIGFRVVRP